MKKLLSVAWIASVLSACEEVAESEAPESKFEKDNERPKEHGLYDIEVSKDLGDYELKTVSSSGGSCSDD